MTDNLETATTLIPADKLAEFFHASKSKARARLVDAMYTSQAKGFTVSQSHTGQTSFIYSCEVDAPSWATDRGLCQSGDKLSQSVELCFTGRDSLSILLRVYRGHCYTQADWQHVSMKRAVQVLQEPACTLT